MYANLKLQIFRMGIHQNLLAKEVGIAESVLSKIIHGYREPSGAERRMIAAYLRADEEWLFEKFCGHAAKNAALLQRERGQNGGF